MTAQPLTMPRSPIQFTLITSQSALTATLAALLQAQVSQNDALRNPPAKTVFHALEPPAISVADYVARVSKFVFCSEACLVAAYHYVNMVVQREPKLALTSLTVHRLLITAIVLACKYFDDVSYNLVYYAKVGGLPFKELANLEIQMLSILDFRLDIPAGKFCDIEKQMMTELSMLELATVRPVVKTLVNKAKTALSQADLQPIEYELLSDEEDADFFYTPAVTTTFIPTSPASSSSSLESSMSRNSSVESMQDEMVFKCRQQPAPRRGFFKGFTHSPTTPASRMLPRRSLTRY